MGPAPSRKDLIESIQRRRRSKVLTYFVADRQPIPAQIGEDAVRPMYEHLLSLGRSREIDLFVYARGGMIEVPLENSYNDPGVSTEDIMSYLSFLKDTEKADLSDQSARALLITKLVESLDPSFLGQINRVHSHIRDVARKMLTSRNSQFSLKEPTINSIIDQLAEKTYQHGHAIGRREAAEIGLNVSLPPRPLEDSMWQFFSFYEEFCQLQNPIDPQTFVPPGAEERREPLVIACIESANLAHHFEMELVGV